MHKNCVRLDKDWGLMPIQTLYDDPYSFKNSSILCYCIKTVSADVTQPEQARQSWSVTDAILSAFDLIKSGLGLLTYVLSWVSSGVVYKSIFEELGKSGLIHSREGARKSSRSDNLFANIFIKL